jgi:hypothetical protein
LQYPGETVLLLKLIPKKYCFNDRITHREPIAPAHQLAPS